MLAITDTRYAHLAKFFHFNIIHYENAPQIYDMLHIIPEDFSFLYSNLGEYFVYQKEGKCLRKLISVACATWILASSWALGGTVYADTGGTTPGGVQDATQLGDPPQQDIMGPESGVLRPGANPDDPNDYAFLPPTMQPPTAGPRRDFPRAPQANAPTNTSTVTTTVNTSVYGSVYSGPPSPPAPLPDLALGKPYTLGTQWPDALFQASESHFPNTGQLTDGQFASTSFSDKGWVGFLRQYGRSVVVNLGAVENVQGVSLDFLQNLGAGIDFPNSVSYYGSNDGSTWHRLGTAWSANGWGDYTPQTQSYAITTDTSAQYIRAEFEDKVFSFADEFSVFGTPGSDNSGDHNLQGRGRDLTQIMGNDFLVDPTVSTIPLPTGLPLPGIPQPGFPQGESSSNGPGQSGFSQSTSPDTEFSATGSAMSGFPTGRFMASPPSDESIQSSGYLTPDGPNSGHVHNMQLVYTDGNGALGTWSQSDFTPMVAQEDASGKPTGWMFDASLFLPYSTTPTTATGWTSWLDNLFSPSIQLSALDQTVGTLKQQLNDPNFKEKVVITIPGLVSHPSNFGAIDSSGQNMDLNPADVGAATADENKVKVIQWYIQQVMTDWKQAGYTNLSLVGFYWMPEALNVADPYDPELIQATSFLVHMTHMNFYWIPYYGAPGITEWRQLGFDDVMIQPGVSFNWSINPAARLQSTAQMGQFYHTGVEIEQHWNVVSTKTALAQTAQNKYYDYFTGGNVFGYEGNVMKSYYLNSKTLLVAYQNADPFYHQIYDNTVQFINNKWTSTTFQ